MWNIRCNLANRGSEVPSKAWLSTNLCRLLPVAIVVCLGCRRMPPNLSMCTRIEIHYPYGVFSYLFPDRALQKGILTKEEEESAKSYENRIVDNQEMIRTLARDISQATYLHRPRGHPPSTAISLVCYSAAERVASLTIYREIVVTQDGSQFKCPAGLPDLTPFEPPGVRNIEARYLCATNLCRLFTARFSRPREALSYPDANRWCDMVVETLRNEYRIELDKGSLRERSYSDATIEGMFVCPAAQRPNGVVGTLPPATETRRSTRSPGPWRSDYAMNPTCKRESPPDTVLLFETESGWNQYGGAELFTFDNHDPKGGCVLLNDGKVKFIRTEEELKQLRWK